MKPRKNAIRRWVTRDSDRTPSADIWHKGKPYVEEYYRWWTTEDGMSDLVSLTTLQAMGVRVPTDRPILVEFTARVVPTEEGDDE